MPHPDAEVMCTMVYGMRERTVELEGPFESGMTDTVIINRMAADEGNVEADPRPARAQLRWRLVLCDAGRAVDRCCRRIT
jgi:hypothetical protein